jgi:hypothetical protein
MNPWYTSPEWWLVILGFPTIIFIAWQAIATRQAAVAAEANTNVIINSERAWVVVKPYKWSPEFFPKWEAGDTKPEGDMGTWPISHRFPAQITNVGRTPAQIEGIAIHYVRLSTNPSQLAAEPNYGEIISQKVLLVPNDELAVVSTLSPDDGTLTKAQVSAIAAKKEFLYAYGIVKYRDVHEREHETRFGYLYSTPPEYRIMKEGKIEPISFDKAIFRPGGPPAYNRNT